MIGITVEEIIPRCVEAIRRVYASPRLAVFEVSLAFKWASVCYVSDPIYDSSLPVAPEKVEVSMARSAAQFDKRAAMLTFTDVPFKPRVVHSTHKYGLLLVVIDEAAFDADDFVYLSADPEPPA